MIWLLALVAPSAASAQLAPPSNGGAPRLDAILHQLAEPHRLLIVAAHPDDEDNGALALLTRGHGVSVAYLSLSRGEGGQNVIGPQLGTDLGLLRTQELLSARRIDGGTQFFTRAFDFGFTRDLAETERAWLPDSILKDVVRVMRRFRPHVIVSVFSGTARDGHGQHQMAGLMAARGFAAAGDPALFPELEREEGLRPWRPAKLYRSARFNRAGLTLTLDDPELDPAAGRTFSQIAAEARSQHRSQDFGALQPLGPADVRLALIESRAALPDTALFGGLPGEQTWLNRLADSLRSRLVPARLDALVPALAAAVTRFRQQGSEEPGDGALLEEALAIAAGIVIDARAGAERLVPGDTTSVEIEVYRGTAVPVEPVDLRIVAAAGAWCDTIRLAPAAVARSGITVPRDAAPTQPYFLVRPLRGAMYDWSETAARLRGLPMEEPPLTAIVRLRIAGTVVELRRELTWRSLDQAAGEIRRPVRVAPRVEITVAPDTIVWPATTGDTHSVVVTLRHQGTQAVAGRVRLTAGEWPAPADQPFRLSGAGETRELRFVLRRPAGVSRTDIIVLASAVSDDGEEWHVGSGEIAYPHVRPVTRLRRAETRVRLAPIAIPSLRRLGYVRGAADRVPEALAAIGLPVVLLRAGDLLRGDLSEFDAIVVGSRAFETDSTLKRSNDRLLAYARNGGRVIVQYQQYQYVRGGYAPAPLDIAQPHDRVTDETSPVRILLTNHPIFRAPNRIEPADWNGWPQERGLYFAGTWDPAWTALLELQDPAGPPLRGGLLVARVGRGSYIYTGLSFFRALPAGTPGAFRLFLNLLAWDGSNE